MRAEREDRSIYRQHKKKSPWLIIGIITAINLTALFLLKNSEWGGIIIDSNKLSEAFHFRQNNDNKSNDHSNQLKADLTHPFEEDSPNLSLIQQAPVLQPEDTKYLTSRKIEMPAAYSLSLNKFNRIFIYHPSCDPRNMKWTQMDCSNFRARAMKRFQKEWSKGSYWDGNKVISNKSADRIVNSELYD